MPVYEFYCRTCERTFTERMRVDEHQARVPPCPLCDSSEEVEKRIGGAFVITKRKS